MLKTTEKIEILFVQRHFSHYRKAFYDRLSQLYSIKLVHANIESSIKTVKSDYAEERCYLRYGKRSTNVFIFSFLDIIRYCPNIVVYEFNPSILSIYSDFILCKIFRIKFVVWGHGFNRTISPNDKFRSLKRRLRICLAKLSDAVIFYDSGTKILFDRYINSKKSFVATNSIDIRALREIRIQLTSATNSKENNWGILFISRLIANKKPGLAIEIIRRIIDLRPSSKIKLYFIGAGTEFEELEKLVAKYKLMNSVDFFGEIYDDRKIVEIALRCDLILIPGDVGLSINQAFGLNLPVFTYKSSKNGPFHGPEISYLKNGITGFFASAYSVDDMALQILNYLENPGLKLSIQQNMETFSQKYLMIENMIEGYIHCYEFLMSHEK